MRTVIIEEMEQTGAQAQPPQALLGKVMQY